MRVIINFLKANALYCIEIHTKDARKVGETEQRIYALSAWEESPLFTTEERSALALTEEITKISEPGVKDLTFENPQRYFTDTNWPKSSSQLIK